MEVGTITTSINMLGAARGSGSDSDQRRYMPITDIFFWHNDYHSQMDTKNNKKPIPLAYIITCRTYGTWLHGDKRKSVDPKHNEFGTPKIKYDPDLQTNMNNLCNERPFLMNASQRETVLQSVINTCKFANWYLYAANIRSNHMHIVVSASKEPEKVSVSFKAYATRYLKQAYPELNRERFWSRGASTGYIFQPEFLLRAIQYTVEEQGKEMAIYCDPSYCEVIERV